MDLHTDGKKHAVPGDYATCPDYKKERRLTSNILPYSLPEKNKQHGRTKRARTTNDCETEPEPTRRKIKKSSQGPEPADNTRKLYISPELMAKIRKFEEMGGFPKSKWRIAEEQKKAASLEKHRRALKDKKRTDCEKEERRRSG